MGSGSLKIGALVLSPVTMRHLLGLSAIESQLVTGKITGRVIYEMFRALVILSAKAEEVAALVQLALDRPEEYEKLVWELADTLKPADTTDLGPRLDAHIDRAFGVAPTAGATAEGEQERPFDPTSPPAGGSAPSPSGSAASGPG
jgi:hypothetical protein